MLTEALLGAITETVIERVANIAGLEDRLRQWLGRDPARLAFKKAFTRAYTAFARQYPELAASFFDEHFLTVHAAPELARLLSRNQHPDPAALAALWAKQFHIEAPNITPAISDLLQWLKAELQTEEVFRPVFDSRALETLPALEAKIDALIVALQQQATQAQQLANRYNVRTEGGTAILGEVYTGGNLIGRDQNVYNYYFQGDFGTLEDYYVRPDAVFQRVKIDEFVGRAWLDSKVDQFLHDPKCKFRLSNQQNSGVKISSLVSR
jgi:hypothetical protein